MPTVCMRRLREHRVVTRRHMRLVGITLNNESTRQQEKHLIAQISTMGHKSPDSYFIIGLRF